MRELVPIATLRPRGNHPEEKTDKLEEENNRKMVPDS